MISKTPSENITDERTCSSENPDKKSISPAKRIERREFLKFTGGALVFVATQYISTVPIASSVRNLVSASPLCIPGWQGTVLIDSEALSNWSVEYDSGSSGSLEVVPGLIGQTVQLDWDLGHE